MISLILKHLKGTARACAVLAPIAMCVEVAMDLQMPRLMAKIIDVGVASRDLRYVLTMGAAMAALSAVGFVGGASCSLLSARAAVPMAGSLRKGLFAKIQGLSFSEIDRFGTSSLVTRLTNDVQQMQGMLVMMLRVMVRSPLILLGSVVMAVSLSPSIAIVFAFILPFAALCAAIVLRKSTAAFAVVQTDLDGVNLVMRENLLGARVVKAFVLETARKARFVEKNERLADSSVRAQRTTFFLQPTVTFALNASVVAILWFGGYRVIGGELEIGKVMAFVNYLVQISHSLLMAVNLVVNVSRAQASSARIEEVLSAIPSVTEPERPQATGGFALEFRDVAFSYAGSGAPALKGVSFTVAEGETLGVIGATGSGKSTLASLIPRLYDPSGGQVLLGGVDARNLSIADVRGRVAFVTQETILFSGTVEENLSIGKPGATKAQLDEACRDACADGFLRAGGYGAIVEQRGRNFSGGQKQRLSIARALLRDARVIVLDDATSAVDLKTEARLRAAIRERTRGATVIVIAQRVSAVAGADRVIVLDDGKIVGLGTHRELLRDCPQYRDIVASQLGKEALEHGN